MLNSFMGGSNQNSIPNDFNNFCQLYVKPHLNFVKRADQTTIGLLKRDESIWETSIPFLASSASIDSKIIEVGPSPNGSSPNSVSGRGSIASKRRTFEVPVNAEVIYHKPESTKSTVVVRAIVNEELLKTLKRYLYSGMLGNSSLRMKELFKGTAF